jgi:gliding motility-associated-like protein
MKGRIPATGPDKMQFKPIIKALEGPFRFLYLEGNNILVSCRHILLLTLCLFFLGARATHIVGGELFYDYLGKETDGRNIYRITLKIFRDCGPNTAQFDGIGPSPALITVLDASGINEGVFNIGMPSVSVVPPTINSACMTVPDDVCVEEGVYVYTLSLAPRAGGYDVIYQRCCRNHSILNLAAPGSQGSTYFAHIPGPEDAAINSSPRFVNYPPIFLCNGFDFSYTQAAVDPDGDQLVYKFSTPYQGLDVCCPALNSIPSTANCSSPPPSCPSQAGTGPYPSVNYLAPFSAFYPAPSSPSLAINPVTGAMSGAPSLTGQYVVNVCVEEFRNGRLLSRHFRDFQFNMLQCDGVLSQFRNQEKCQGTNFNFTNTSYNASTFHWDFGVPGTTGDTSSLANPTYIFPDTGTFVVTLIVNPGGACSDTDQKIVKVYPPLDIGFTPPSRQCVANNLFSFKTEGTYATNTKFRWDFAATAIPPSSTLRNPVSVSFASPGNYFIKLLATHFACVDSVIDTLVVLPMPQVLIEDPGLLCEPASTKFRNRVPNDMPITYDWKTSAGERSNMGEPLFKFKVADSYSAQLVGTAFGMCRDTSVVLFQVHSTPDAGFEVIPDKVTVLEPEVKIKSLVGDAVHYVYAFGDGSTADFISGTHAYNLEGNYVITQYIINMFGCTDSASRMVKVLPEHRFWMPNVFTPDQNGLNDTFGPTLIGVSHYELRIYDRWGELVFSSADPLAGWDGRFRGGECPQGVYVYLLTFKDVVEGSLEERAGHVTLLRNR